MAYRAISLFSGAGGLDIGFERAGFSSVFACERDNASASTWMINRPEYKTVMHVGDIETLFEKIRCLSSIDLVYGGPPCQGFSVAGKMDDKDPRNELVHAFMRVVAIIRPRVFVMENVKNLAVSSRWTKIRETISSQAAALGYKVAFNVYNAADFGVSENRERLLLLGVQSELADFQRFSDVLNDKKQKPPRVRTVLNDVGKYGSIANPPTCFAKVSVAKRPIIRKSAYSGMLVNGSGRPIRLDGIAQTLTASMGGNGTPIVDQRALDDPSAQNWFEGLYDIAKANASLPDCVPKYIRRLTICEAAAIQTFPKEYKFAGSRCSQYRQIGNAVPCKLAESVALSLRQVYFDS